MNIDEARSSQRPNDDDDPRYADDSSVRDGVDGRLERRQRVCDDAMEEALALADPFDALVAANTAMLARVEAAVGERVVATLEDPEMPLEDSVEGVSMLMRISRQLERNSQLRRRDRETLRRERVKPLRRWNGFDG